MFFLCRLMERKSFFYANYFNWSPESLISWVHNERFEENKSSIDISKNISWKNVVILIILPSVDNFQFRNDRNSHAPKGFLTRIKKLDGHVFTPWKQTVYTTKGTERLLQPNFR